MEENARVLEWNFKNDFLPLCENWLPPPGSSKLPDKSGLDQDHVKTESMKIPFPLTSYKDYGEK